MKSVRLSVAPLTGAVTRATGSACGAEISSTPRSSSSARRAAISSSSSSCSCAYASRTSSSSSPSSSASSMKARGSSSASLVSSVHSFFHLCKERAPGRRLHHLKRFPGALYSLLQQDLPGFLMGQDLSLDPLQRVVDGLCVAAQLLGHLLVGRSLQVET